MKGYHNTTEASGPLLNKYVGIAKTQEEIILAWFKRTGERAGPSAVYLACVLPVAVPITSIRRAMTELAHKGLLVKTEKQAKGSYGRLEYQWELPQRNEQRRLF